MILELDSSGLIGMLTIWGLAFSVMLHHLIELSRKDRLYRYADPKEWRPVWMATMFPAFITWCYIGIDHFWWIVGSFVWIIITYAAAFFKLMGGQDARVLILAGVLFPHWLTIPLIFCGSLILAHRQKKKLSAEELADWQLRGIPLIPYLCVCWVIAAVVYSIIVMIP